MILSRWIRRSTRPARTFRPAVLPLEDRTVPSGFGLGLGHFSNPGPATHLQVIVPENVQAGQTFAVKVEALDASNRIATGFTDAVSLSSGDSTAKGSATYGSALTALPLSYTFTASDHGVHLFQVQLTTVGAETIGAADAATNSTVTGDTETTNVNPAPVATKVVVITPETAATGVATPVKVEVLDQSGHLLRNFTGQVTLSADAAANGAINRHSTAAALPITYTFTAADHGEHTFQVTFTSTVTAATPATVTAATTTPALSGSAQLTLYPPTTVTHFGVFVLPFAIAGGATPLQVVALNASNQVVSGYTGTVTLTSSDTAATASTTRGGTQTSLSGATPFTYQFTSADAGKHIFFVKFNTTGSQTLTVSDSANSLTDTETVRVLSLPHPKGWFI